MIRYASGLAATRSRLLERNGWDAVFHEWDPITDLPADWPALHLKELDLVREQWLKEKSILQDPKKLEELKERLATLWAIETGIIERLYTVDRGVTLTLIELGLGAIDKFHQTGALSRDAVLLIQDQRAALEFVFDFIREQRELSTSYIKELHQLLTQNQESSAGVDQFGNRVNVELIKGAWKKLPNNPTRPDGLVHEYCPPEFVQDEIDQLLVLHAEHVKKRVPADVESAWIHHRFTQVHPFQDGNGRVARAIATLVFLKEDYLPLVIRDSEHKDAYMSALEAADGGDLAPLVSLFATIQQRDLTESIEIVRSLRGEGIARIAESAAERAKIRLTEAEQGVLALTDQLHNIASMRLQEVRRELTVQFDREGVALDAWVGFSTPEIETWWGAQIVAIAKHHGYWADLSKARRWAQLRLRLPDFGRTQTNIVISFHANSKIAGLMVADAFMSSSTIGGDARGNGISEEWEVVPVSDHPFTYSASHRDAEGEFRDWLERTMDTALDQWQSRI